MTTKQAVFFNFLSAFFCYLGLILGSCLGREPQAARIIIAITAGVFLYISVRGIILLMHWNNRYGPRRYIRIWKLFAIQKLESLEKYAVFPVAVCMTHINFWSI